MKGGWAWVCIYVAAQLLATLSAEDKDVCYLSRNNNNFLLEPVPSTESAKSKCPSTQSTQQTTCCSDAWYASIGVDDPFTSSLQKLGSVSEGCRAKVAELACGVCTRHQHAIASSTSYGGVVFPCYSYCSSLLTACASATLNDRVVSEVYGTDGEWFCFDLLGQASGNLTATPKDDATHSCFSDVKRECTEDDYYGYYSECDPKTNTRNYHFIPKETADCAGGVAHTQTIHNLQCYQTCNAGSYLPPGGRACSLCPAGTYAIGGGYYFDQWKEWPKEFEWRTYCENTNGANFDSGVEVTNGSCQGWMLNDTWIEVPESLNDKQNAVLEVMVNLVREGSVSFTFKVNAEPLYDGLMFKVDGKKVMTFYSNAANYETRTYNLTAGIHTLKWVFFKDLSFSDGHDQAWIRSIEVVGVKYSDQACTVCSPGSRSLDGASRCVPCSPNTYSDYPGAAGASCPSCPADKFSYLGSTECLPRQSCVTSDYYSFYSSCVNGVRNKYFVFTEPRICDASALSLPANQTGVPCSPCNPGQYRESSATSCKTCESGTFSDLGASSCAKCPGGTYAMKELFFTQFDRWEELPGVTTSCVGECGTNGWRLLSEDIDSGIGHGTIADVYLETEVTLETSGVATFNFSIVCKDFCRFQFIDVGVENGATTYYASETTRPGPYKFNMNLAAGKHRIQVVFSKYIDTVVTHRDNRLIIHGFKISGVKSGGASTCSPCPAGYFSSEAASVCRACEPGKYSTPGSPLCSLCPEGTFSSTIATNTCTPCGPNTVSRPDRLDCDLLGCTYQPVPGVKYDLSALVSTGDMYGPVWDVTNHAFYLNPCSRVHVNHSCYNKEGDAIPTFACQQLPMGYAMDLGSVMGYLPFEDRDLAGNAEEPYASGLVMVFTGGSPGCAKGASPAYPRSANITFVCDPSAGVGYPEAVEPVEFAPCRYQFKWTSLYACPLCTTKDYVPVYGSCENGKSTKTYLPKNYPNRCHGGVQAPPSEVVACTAVAKNCSSGTYFPITSSEKDDCVPAAPGHYSVGGGFVVDIFTTVDAFPPAFSRDFSWVPLGEFVTSGEGDTSMTASVYLVQPGYVSFVYKIVASGLDLIVKDGGFYFDVDGVTYIRGATTTYYRYSTSVVHLQPGTHIFRWRFIGGQYPTTNSRGYYATIDKIMVVGTEYSARQDIPCREGYYQNNSGATHCRECKSNTKSTAGQATCTPCPNSTYSLRGSSDCDFTATCQERDYTITYSECKNGKRTKYYMPLHPVLCSPGKKALFSDNATEFPCPNCPPGFIVDVSSEGVTKCFPCALGTYFSAGECIPAPAGTKTNLQITYFNSADVLPAVPFSDSQPWKLFPAEFSTVCNGKCGTNGWRVSNRSVESGFHSVIGEVDSELFMETMFVQEGSLRFTYRLNGLKSAAEAADNGLPGFEFFIDGLDEDKSILYRPQEDREVVATITKIPPGRHVLHWVFHQPWGSNRQQRLFLSDIQLNGTTKGTALDYSNCPRGTYAAEGSYLCLPCSPGTSSGERAEQCLLCGANTYTEVFGAPACEQCGFGMTALEDRTGCDTKGCVFTNEANQTFDLRELNRPVSIISPVGGHRLEFNLCNKLTVESQCFDEKNRLLNGTYQCVVNMDNGVGKDAGKIFNVLYEKGDLRLRYTHGASCNTGASQLYTDIYFLCDPSVKNFIPPVVVTDATCHIQYEWAHIAGCRVCTEEDYDLQHGECIEGMKSVVSVRKNACNGPEAKQLDKVKCVPTLNVSIPLIAVGGGVFLFLVLVLLVVAIRNKKMSDQYEILLQNSSVSKDSKVSSAANDEAVEMEELEKEEE